MANVALRGSERSALPAARALRAADPHERLEVSVMVRPRDAAGLQARVAALHAAARERRSGAATRAPRALSREAFARRHAARSSDLRAVAAFARAHGLAVVLAHAARRTVVLSGTVAQFSAAFAVELHDYELAAGTYRGRTGVIQIPAELRDIVQAVLGLDNRPQARSHMRIARAAPSASFTPLQLASLYDFPPGSGAGQCVALIELGGGYRPADLQTYFEALGVGAPEVSAVSVDHATNAPTGSPDGPDGEVMLDIEVAGAIAPAARIVAYFAPNSDAGFLDAVTSAIHDTTRRPSVISISWGGAESSWTAQAMSAMDGAFQAAAAMGICVCIASGDNGSSDGVAGGGEHVDFPASSPHALACGGTRLTAAGDTIGSEVVWNDGASGGASGGDVSSYFALPAWQSGLAAHDSEGVSVPLQKRGVPDVAGDADPDTGYQVRVDGSDMVIGGTSAVAPLWAALVARINAGAPTPAGFLNARLYGDPGALRDVIQGNNGAFAAAPGWDACTGLGTPAGVKLARLL